MIEQIRFENFRVLRKATLSLKPFNVIIGPNGSGKSTVFKALEIGRAPRNFSLEMLRTVGSSGHVRLDIDWVEKNRRITSVDVWDSGKKHQRGFPQNQQFQGIVEAADALFKAAQIFAFDVSKIAATVQLQPNTVLSKDGANIAGALDNLRDISEESFESLKGEMREWLPEFDSILFETPALGQRNFKLRQSVSKQSIKSTDLSEGTLLALALLYLAHNPSPPGVICLEEPDRGLHPRLLRDLRDGLYRLSYPDQFGIKREPVQVIVTTHSPYFLDLFKDHPEEIIIAEKQPDATATFKSLADDKELMEMIGDAPLGEVWYSGVLGGVPTRKQ